MDAERAERRAWDLRACETMRDMRERGYTLERIADIYGTTFQQVQRCLRKARRK